MTTLGDPSGELSAAAAMTSTQWAELRQVGFATLAHEVDVKAAIDLLELGPGFDDPLLAAMHLADFTAPIGPDTYIEVLAPTTPDHSVARWLRKAGGSAGWVLSTQVPSLVGVRERAADRGVRVAVDTQAMGHDIIQLHPLDVGGVLLELDEFLPRGAWFWDEMESARIAQAGRSPRVDNIVAVDVAADDPAALAATWAAIIGIDAPVPTTDGAQIEFSSRTIRFVPARGDRTGIVAVDLHATDRANGVGDSAQLCSTLIRFV
jgi:hypothetical protein